MNMVYLNNASTTKPDKQVLDDFMWCAENYWANPSDVSQDAADSHDIIKQAQIKIAKTLHTEPEEIIFTSGGSESNNWAIKGFLDRNKEYSSIITTEIEHPSVYNTCQYLESRDYKVYYIKLDNYGLVSPALLEKKIIDKKIEHPFVTIMYANNEIGTVEPIKEIANVVHRHNGVLHVDAVQGFMHEDIDVQDLDLDLMSVSFHKFGGFKNCGFLYIKNGIMLTPLIHGGHQFDGKRAGTENIPMIYAMGEQVERLNEHFSSTQDRIKEIYDYTVDSICNKCNGLCEFYFNGHPNNRLYNIISVTFKGIPSNELITLLEMKNVCVSGGSACCSGESKPSRVLQAIGLSDDDARSTIRISISAGTIKEDIDIFVNALVKCITDLKRFRNYDAY